MKKDFYRITVLSLSLMAFVFSFTRCTESLGQIEKPEEITGLSEAENNGVLLGSDKFSEIIDQ